MVYDLVTNSVSDPNRVCRPPRGKPPVGFHFIEGGVGGSPPPTYIIPYIIPYKMENIR